MKYKPVSMSSVRRLVGNDWLIFHEVVVNPHGENTKIFYFECPIAAAQFYLGVFDSK